VGTDPEITEGVFENDWRNADYILATPGVLGDAGDPRMKLAQEMVTHSSVVAHFDTGGWPTSILRINKLQTIPATSVVILQQLWDELTRSHILNGRVVDVAGGITRAPSQATAMLQAVYMHDKVTFDALWAWSQAHMISGSSGLMNAEWREDSPEQGGRSPVAVDIAATQDAALALVFANRAWGGAYSGQALALLNSLWDGGTVAVGQWRVPALASQVMTNRVAKVSLNDVAPAAYRIFADVDTQHDWTDVVTGTYRLVALARLAQGLGPGVLPDAVSVSPSWAISIPVGVTGSSLPAMNAGWRLAVDWLWSNDVRSRQAAAIMDVVRSAADQQQPLPASYNLDGSPRGNQASMAAYASAVGILLAGTTPDLSEQVLAERVLLPALSDTPHSASDLLAAWAATAMLDGGLSDLWSGESTIRWANVRLAGITARNG
jgi:hypothetical protein